MSLVVEAPSRYAAKHHAMDRPGRSAVSSAGCRGRTVLSARLSSSESWHEDPGRSLFRLSRYKSVAKSAVPTQIDGRPGSCRRRWYGRRHRLR
jgi:hypothetical protein